MSGMVKTCNGLQAGFFAASLSVFFSPVSLSFFFWGMVTGDGHGGWSRDMVTGDGHGRWLREMVTGSLCFPPFGGWLREMVTGSLCFLLFLSISLIFFFWGIVTGDGYRRWLREVFVFLFFSFEEWLREMVTGSLCFPPLGAGYGRRLLEVFVFSFSLSFFF